MSRDSREGTSRRIVQCSYLTVLKKVYTEVYELTVSGVMECLDVIGLLTLLSNAMNVNDVGEFDMR